MENKTKSVLRYIGTKDIDLREYSIDNYKVYCEPFSGGFNTGINLINSGYKGRIIYNDLDKQPYEFWVALIENADLLYNKCIELYEGIDKNDNIADTLNCLYDDKSLYVRAAAEYLYRLFRNIAGYNHKNIYKHINKLDFLLQSELLSSENVELYNKDYKQIIKETNSKDTFYLIDPPYFSLKATDTYRVNSSKFNHDELSKYVKELQGGWLLTYNKCEYIENLYKGYNSNEVRNKRCKEIYITK